MKKNKYIIRTHFNYQPSKGEVNSGELLVVPDEAYTIEEILDRFARGINLGITLNGEYSDTDDFDDVDERSQILDFTDIPEAQERMENRRAKREKAKTQDNQQKTKLAESQSDKPE